MTLPSSKATPGRGVGSEPVAMTMFLVQRGLGAALGFDLDFAGAGDAAEALHHVDLVLLHQEFDALGQGLDAVVLGLVHLGQVQLGLHFDADAGEFDVGGLIQFRGVQQGLRRHAADVQAGAAQGRALFDQGGLQPQLSGADGGVVAARPAPDDHHVVGLGSGVGHMVL